MSELRERLAELVHKQWSGWMKYLFDQGEFNEDGTWTMPKWAVLGWLRQMNTDYADLSETEKESDKKEADKFIAVIEYIGKGKELMMNKCPACGKRSRIIYTTCDARYPTIYMCINEHLWSLRGKKSDMFAKTYEPAGVVDAVKMVSKIDGL